MKNLFDLQIQTTASDGRHTPREVVAMAKPGGLHTIAVTDHDTVGGVGEALLAGGEFGVRVIPGIEMSVEEHGAHILGYGIDYKNIILLSELEKFREGRVAGAQKMVANLNQAGFAVSWGDVMRQAAGGVVARPHIARAVLERPENKEKLGGTTTVYEFIEAYLGNDNPLYVRRTHITAKDAIALLHRAGGVAVWSHPVVHFQNDYDGVEQFLKELIVQGIDGIEVFTPSHSEDDAEFVNGLALHHHILRTAGSDFHEAGQEKKAVPGESGVVALRAAAAVGDYETYGFPVEDIISELDHAMVRARTQPAIAISQ